jgi:hypothetical protein
MASPTNVPPPRSNGGTTYLKTLGEAVMFGGEGQDSHGNGYAIDDTWAWRSGQWTNRTPVRAVPIVYAVFYVVVVTASTPPPGEVFELELTKPDGTKVVTLLCAFLDPNECKGVPTHYVWSFEPASNMSHSGSYRALYGQGNPTIEFARGTVSLVNSQSYYLEYKGV